MTIRRSALYAAIALAALTIAAALGLGRVFADGSFALPIIGVALLPHLIGAVARARRWHGAVLTLITLAVVFLYVALVIAPSSTTYGLPGVGTVKVLADRLADGWEVFRHGRAPVPVTDGVLLLCMVLTAIVAATADALAFRSEATLGAVVPSLLLFVFASTLGTTELRTATTIGYCVVALVFLMLQHQALLEGHRSWASGRRIGSQATLVNAAAFVGGIALLAGLVVAPAIPGVDDGPLIDYRSLGGSGGSGPSSYRTLSPLVDMRARLTEQPDTELFTVEAPTRLYWRIAALDQFDGEVWGIESQARDVGEALGRDRPAGTVRQKFTITALDDQWLPAAYEPMATDLQDARVVPESGTLLAPDREITGLTYRVDSRVAPEPTAAQIASTENAVPARFLSSLTLPEDFPASVTRRARAIVGARREPVRAGEGARGVLHRWQLHLRPARAGRERVRCNHELPPVPSGVLRAVRRRVRGDGAIGRAPCARRGRLRARRLPDRPGPLQRARSGRPRLARGLAVRTRVDPVRADPGRHRTGTGRPDRRLAGGRGHECADHGHHRADDSHDRRRRDSEHVPAR